MTYVLCMIIFTIQENSFNNFAIHMDVSTRNRTKDLSNCGDKTIFVNLSTITVDENVANDYNTVVDMEEYTNDYHKLYSTDISKKLQLKKSKLPHRLKIPTLLNLLFDP